MHANCLMKVILATLLAFALPLHVFGKPVPQTSGDGSNAGTRRDLFNSVHSFLNSLCGIPIIGQFLCPPTGLLANLQIPTPLGTARGFSNNPSVVRFAVKYANANRWQASSVATVWQLPNGSTNPSSLPLACPQPPSTENSQDTDEDCLSMILYVPTSAIAGRVPTIVWIHGGSFIVGSATGPGLDGSSLAAATNSIVAVVQYRLGAFGFMAPSGETNHAVKDVINALQFLKRVLPSFNGDPSKVTIAGQSSGATMVRALLAAPSADSLFQSAILQSDPMDYGFLQNGAQQTLLNTFKSMLPCSATDTQCLNSITTDNVLNFSLMLFGSAPMVEPSAGAFEPIRPVRDGSLITTSLTSSTPFPNVRKPVLITTVKNEAGNAIYGMVNPNPVSEADFPTVVNGTFGEPRTSVLLSSGRYSAPPTATGGNNSTTDARVQLESMGTDSMWRCPSWTFARSWASHGGRAYVGEYALGASYPSNAGVDFCLQAGNVCHEDDIQIVFGTVQSPSNAQSALVREIQARYRAFLNTGNPNPTGSAGNGLRQWQAVNGQDVKPISLGGNGDAPVGSCVPSFWGQAVLYDYQVFGI